MSKRPEVLVVGAGPTGLTLALQARAHGAAVRIVDRRPDAFRPSRALIVHPRTLEVLRPLGVTEELLARADTSPRVRLHLGTRSVPISLTELDLPDTAFPHLTLLRQADTEAVLDRALAHRGVRVERGSRVLGVRHTADGPCARLRNRDEDTDVVCAAVVGCDGTNSTIRRGLGIGWPGGTYRQEVVLADLDLEDNGANGLEPGVAQVVAGRRGLLFLFPLGERAAWRMLATRPTGRAGPPVDRPGQAMPPAELQHLIDETGLGVRISRVTWSSQVGVQHRIADRYRLGRVFLAGDAAHASSPAGGTGMNTGIQDAVNLGWKLALARFSAAPEELLASYEAERRPVAQQLLALTHMIFWAESSTDALASVLRGTFAPVLAPAIPQVMRRRRLVGEGVRLLSRLHTHYRRSPLSDGGSPRGRHLRAGDRLPDADVICDGRQTRLHALLASPGVHVLLDRDAPEPAPNTAGAYLRIHRLTTTPGTGLIAVRPDGYVGFSSGWADEEGLRCWLERAGALALRATTCASSGISRTHQL